MNKLEKAGEDLEKVGNGLNSCGSAIMGIVALVVIIFIFHSCTSAPSKSASSTKEQAKYSYMADAESAVKHYVPSVKFSHQLSNWDISERSNNSVDLSTKTTDDTGSQRVYVTLKFSDDAHTSYTVTKVHVDGHEYN